MYRVSISTAAGREKGEDPYYTHLYRVGLDGNGMTVLNPGDANQSANMAPSQRYFVNNASRVDGVPSATLVCEGFLGLAESSSVGLGMPNLPVALVPGHTGVQSDEVLRRNILEVTLDRVVCCYPDARALIGRSAAKARRLYGLVHPVDRWWTRLLATLGNAGYRLFRNPYRMHVHRQRLIDELVAEAGLRPVTVREAWFWRTAVYRRSDPSPAT